MKYLFIGAGAMGCVLAGHMTRSGKDVTMIGRGENLRAIQADGLKMYTPSLGDIVVPIKIMTEDEYQDRPDVVIVCIKAYAFDTIKPLLNRICDESTIVLPLLNAIRFGDKIAAGLTAKPIVLEGVAYVACDRVAPGNVKQKLDFFDIVFGMRQGHEQIPELEQMQQDFVDSSASATISPNMLQSALRKFVRVSTISAVLVYYGGTCGDIASSPERLDFLGDLSREVVAIAEASGCPFAADDDLVGWARDSVLNVFPEYRTSLKTDYDAGRPIESQTQFMDVYELGRSLGLELPAYGEVVRKCGYDA